MQRLKLKAKNWIETLSGQQSLFSQRAEPLVVQLNQLEYHGFRYGLLYESLYEVSKQFKFHWLRNKLLMDLVIARIAEPTSKMQSIEFLKEYMGIEHSRRELYRQIPRILRTRKTVESKVLEIAKKEFAFNFSLVFYDVTTIYFESFQEDELRQSGFSKDNKFTQPQILLGLLVSNEGFPVGYQIFEGKEFACPPCRADRGRREGHTLIPVILKFKGKHKIERLTIVADAAMISSENIKALTKACLDYIVGARIGNLPMKTIEEVNRKLSARDGRTIRIRTSNGDLVCEFSQKRYVKDKREMEKQITKAEKLLKTPGSIKRIKFIKSQGHQYALNTSLIENKVEEKVAIQLDHFSDGNKLELKLLSYYSNKDTIVTVDDFRSVVKTIYEVKRPKGYLVPKNLSELKQWMDNHNLFYTEAKLGNCEEVEEYFIDSIGTIDSERDTIINPYVAVNEVTEKINLSEYYFLPLKQLKNNVIVIALEPKSMLGLVTYKQFEHLLRNREAFPILRVVN